MNPVLSALRAALIAPFSHPRRSMLYASVFPGVAGSSLLVMMFSYSIAADSAASIVTYWGLYFLASGMILFPALCWVYCALPLAAARGVLAAVSALGFALYGLCHGGADGLAVAAAASVLVSMPFWVSYHIAFSAFSSDEGRGHEVSLAYVVMALGAVCGYGLGGALAENGRQAVNVTLGFSGMGAGTGALLFLLPPHKKDMPFPAALRRALRHCGNGWLVTPGAGGINVLSGYLLPTFLGKTGLPGLEAGIAMALRAGTTALSSPLAGHLVHHGRQKEFSLAVGLYALAWVALLLPGPFVLRLGAAIVLWAAANQFYDSGMDNGWYSARTPAAVAAREIYLNAGRLALLGIAAPWLFAAPGAYPYLALGFCALLGGAFFFLRRRRNLDRTARAAP